VPIPITGPSHLLKGSAYDALALPSVRDCVEPKSYRVALSNAQAQDWQAAMQHEYTFLMDNVTWELVDLPPNCVVVKNMWIYKVKPDT
jgi:hypothetical protein